MMARHAECDIVPQRREVPHKWGYRFGGHFLTVEVGPLGSLSRGLRALRTTFAVGGAAVVAVVGILGGFPVIASSAPASAAPTSIVSTKHAVRAGSAA